MAVRRNRQVVSDDWAIMPDGSVIRADGPTIEIDESTVAQLRQLDLQEIAELVSDLDKPVADEPPIADAHGSDDHATRVAAFREAVAAGRASLENMRERNRRELEADREARDRRALMHSGPRPPVLTDAERKKAKRDEQHAAKVVAAAAGVDHGALVEEFFWRCEALERRLSVRPLPPKLKHLAGREEEYTSAWAARELAKVPPEKRRNGRPGAFVRAAEVFDETMGLPPGTTSGEAMKRKLKVVDYLEAEVWGLRPIPEGC